LINIILEEAKVKRLLKNISFFFFLIRNKKTG